MEIRYALIKNGIVDNVIVADADFIAAISHQYDRCELLDTPDEQKVAGLGWRYVDGVFIAPPEPESGTPTYKSWSAFDFYRKFSSAERIAIRTRTNTDPIAEDIYSTLNAAIASGANIRDDDPDTTNGLAYLESVGVLAAGRAAEILA